MTLTYGERISSSAPAFDRIRAPRWRWFTFPALLSLLAGLLTNLRFQFVGRASVGEILLALVAIFAVLANIGNPRFWNRRMLIAIAALSITFSGYILSDLINGTPPDRLIRGWARMGFLILDFVAIWALARNSMVNLFALCVGDAMSTLLSYGAENSDFFYNYKFHLAMPLTVIVSIVVPLLLRRVANLATGVGLVMVGMLHLWLDYRMLGGICILIGFVLTARCMAVSRLRSLYLAMLALAIVLSSTAIVYLYRTTNDSFGMRRAGSNSARASLAMAGASAIRRSPVFGLGSWVWDNEMWNIYAGEMGRGSTAQQAAGETLGPHSQIVQAWAEAGVLGLVFFLYLGKELAEATWILFFRRALDLMTPLFLYNLLLGVWNLFFSPFANLHRFALALALVICIQILREGTRDKAMG